jgi:hypothetical protein
MNGVSMSHLQGTSAPVGTAVFAKNKPQGIPAVCYSATTLRYSTRTNPHKNNRELRQLYIG